MHTRLHVYIPYTPTKKYPNSIRLRGWRNLAVAPSLPLLSPATLPPEQLPAKPGSYKDGDGGTPPSPSLMVNRLGRRRDRRTRARPRRRWLDPTLSTSNSVPLGRIWAEPRGSAVARRGGGGGGERAAQRQWPRRKGRAKVAAAAAV